MEDYEVFHPNCNMLQIGGTKEVQSSYTSQARTLCTGTGSRELYGVKPYEKEKRSWRPKTIEGGCRNEEATEGIRTTNLYGDNIEESHIMEPYDDGIEGSLAKGITLKSYEGICMERDTRIVGDQNP